MPPTALRTATRPSQSPVSGITTVTITYSNDGAQSSQGVALHDISFDPTPIADNHSVAVNEDAVYTFSESDFGFSDVDGDMLQQVRITSLETAGALKLSGVDVTLDQVIPVASLGLLKFTPAADSNGTPYANFRFQVGDGASYSKSDYSMTVNVDAVVDTVNDVAITNEDNTVTVNVLANDNFADVARTLTGVSAPANGVIAFNASGSVTYTPNTNWNGTEVLTYTVTAGGVTETGTYTITVNAVNDEPSFTLAGDLGINEDAVAQTVVGYANGARGGGPDEAGQTLTYVVSNDNNSLFSAQPTIAANGTLSYTPAANAYGAATISVFLTDSGGTANGGDDTSAIQTFTITVAAAADTPSVTDAATLEDAQTTSGLVISRNAADGVEVTHYKITAITGGTLFLNDGTTIVASGTFITEAQGAAGLRFTPALNSVTVGSFDVQASLAGNNAGLGGSTVTASIAVTPVNDVPSFVLAGNQSVGEDAGAQLVALFASGSPGGGPDEAAQSLTYTVSNDNNGLFAVQPTIAANGTLSFTPTADASGTATVMVFVKDDGGTANGGIDTAVAQTFAISVTPVTDAPTLIVNPASGNEDASIPISISNSLVDTDGSETLAVSVSAIPVGETLTDGVNNFTASAGNQSVVVTGWNFAALSVTSPANSDVDFALAVSATATESANGATATTNANLAVTVNAVADAPSVVFAPAVGNEDTPISLTLTPSLVDTDGSETLAVTVSTIPVGATLTDGVNTFTASAGNQSVVVTGWNFATLTVTPFLDSDTDFPLGVSTTATEGANGATATTSIMLAVDVVPVNDAPVLATNVGLTVDEGGIAVLTPAMLTVTDVDNTNAQLVYLISVSPTNGRLESAAAPGVSVAIFTQDDLDNGRIRYVHDGSETIADALTFSVSDEAGGGIGATVFAITVNPVNDAPALTVNRLSLTDGQTVTLTPADLDATDVDNPPADLSFTVTGIQHGHFELASAPGAAITAFTYNQLAAGEVRFVHAGGNQEPAYVVTPSDLGLAGATTAAQITFVLVSDPGDGNVLLKPRNSVADDPLTVLAPPDTLRFGGLLGFPEVNAPIPVPRGLETFDVIVAPTDPVIAAPSRTTGFAKTDPNVETESMKVLRLPGPVVHMELGNLEFDGPQSRSNIDVLLGMVKMSGLALSVGAVWWATRAAGLIASALSSLPAWRNFDPLPVLGRDEFEEDDWVQEHVRNATAESEEEERLVERRFSNDETQPINLEELRRATAQK